MWLNKDCCGLFCVGFCYSLVFAGASGVFSVLHFDRPVDNLHFLVVCSLLGLSLVSHFKAMTTNPGTVPVIPAGEPLEIIDRKDPQWRDGELVTTCRKCPAYKPYRAHHCSICGRCIRMMDHHCPWVNNCVGENNQKYFVLFVSYICLSSVYSLVLCVSRMYDCGHLKWRGCSEERPHWSAPLIMAGLMLESIVFGLFTCIMWCDQMCNILNDKTAIERLQNKEDAPERASWSSNCKRVFGRPASIWWFLPVESNARYRRKTIQPLLFNAHTV
eukprot:m.307101 g.307101  ORF g.307101 m.307101 type:complete len:273 (+) comp19712_c0_seq1:42-860(+)